MAVFQVEGAAVRRQLTWDCTDGLIGIGIAADLAKVGVERQKVDALLNTVRNHLPHLDAIRMRVIENMPSNSQRLLV